MNIPDWIEAMLWAATAAVATWRALRSPERARRGWWLVAALLALFAFDKLADVYSLLHTAGRFFATLVDPEYQLRGPHSHYRLLLLAGALVAGGLGMWLWMRSEDRPGWGKKLCLLGILLVATIVAVRVAPTLQEIVSHVATKVLEAIAWLLVCVGLAIGNARRPPTPTIEDGFL